MEGSVEGMKMGMFLQEKKCPIEGWETAGVTKLAVTIYIDGMNVLYAERSM